MTKKILVVDDDPAIVKYLVTIFNDNGYETCTASDGAEAFEVLQKKTPDLITLDLEMPKEWGPKFFRRISKKEHLKDIPVIVISGLASRHLSINKAVTWLSKPFDPEQLIEIVKNTIG